MLYGIDVSNWQGSVNWASYAKDGFAFAKATEGTTFTDGQFARNWSQIKSHGLVRGAYHFGHPKNSATAEADHFLKVVRAQGLHDGDLLALDLEANDGRSASSVASWARAWCQHVHSATGVKPIVYTFLSFARGGYCTGLGDYPLWIAAPSYPAGKPPMPLGPWKTWAIHQYSDSPYDKDVSNLTVAQLRALGSTSTPTEDDVPEYVSLSTKQPVKLKTGEPVSVVWDKIFDGEKKDGIIPAAPALAIVEVSCSVPFQLYAQDQDDKERDLGGNNTAVVSLYAGDRLYMRLKPTADGETTPYVKAAYWKS